MNPSELVACHDCDLVHRLPGTFLRGTARCTRCGAVLIRRKKDSIDRTLAMAFTGIVLFSIANAYPFLTFQMETDFQEATLLTGILLLSQQNLQWLAFLVLFTTILAPLVQMTGMVYVLLPLRLGFLLPGSIWVLRHIRHYQPWAMMEVYMLGILVSLAKLAKMATIIPGTAAYAFMVLIFVLAAMTAAFDHHSTWMEIEAMQ
ncbi:MAG: paraquat-inducible protein A [Desulfobacterales bacterium]